MKYPSHHNSITTNWNCILHDKPNSQINTSMIPVLNGVYVNCGRRGGTENVR